MVARWAGAGLSGDLKLGPVVDADSSPLHSSRDARVGDWLVYMVAGGLVALLLLGFPGQREQQRHARLLFGTPLGGPRDPMLRGF